MSSLTPDTQLGITPIVTPIVPVPAAPPGFVIERLLGRGGMGIVYQAIQSGLDRPCALKMLAAPANDMHSPRVSRFLLEAQSMASIRHPNVCPVYQFGTHLGNPYLALELLRGGTLAEYLHRRKRLTAKEAAGLFAAIAEGVEAIHSVGVVHRDLKPGNILFDSDGIPKITDFGLAKRLVGGMNLTRTDCFVGTPGYMAPEQAVPTGYLGPTVDIWSIGVMLYESVTGTHPFPGEDFFQVVVAGLSSLQVTPRRLAPDLPSDLQQIILKCLHPEPKDRYQSAKNLALDLRAFQAGKPISARPLPALVRLLRWSRWHPAYAILLALTLGSCLVGTAVSFYFARQAEDALQQISEEQVKTRAEQQKALEALAVAESALARQQQTRERFRVLLRKITDEELVGKLLAHHDAWNANERAYLASLIAELEAFTAGVGDDRESRTDRAVAHTRIADLHARLGAVKEAVRHYETALHLLQQLTAESPTDRLLQLDRIAILNNLGVTLSEQNRLGEALHRYREALTRAEELTADPSASRDERNALAGTHVNLGNLLRRLGEIPEARARLTTAKNIRVRLTSEEPGNRRYLADLALSRVNLALLLRRMGDNRGASNELLEARAEMLRIVQDDPETFRHQQNLALVRMNLGNLLRDLGSFPDAFFEYEEAKALLQRLATGYPGIPVYRAHLATLLVNRGGLLFRTGRDSEAIIDYRAAQALFRDLNRENPKATAYLSEAARIHNNLGDYYSRREERTTALAEYAEARRLLKELSELQPTISSHRSGLARTANNRALLLVRSGALVEAAEEFETVRRLLEVLCREEPQIPLHRSQLGAVLGNLAHLRLQANRSEEALVLLEEGAQHLRKALTTAPQSPQTRLFLRDNRYNAALALLKSRCPWLLPGTLAELAATTDQRAEDGYFIATAWAKGAEQWQGIGWLATPLQELFRGKAVAALREARTAGFRQNGRLDSEDAFAAIRDRSDFQQIVRDMKKR